MLFKVVMLCAVARIFAVYPSQNGNGQFKKEAGETPKPYDFSYEVQDEEGNKNARQESADEQGVVRGSYNYMLANGVYRTVRYIADGDGFRAVIGTNEPGIDGDQDPADVDITAEDPPEGVVVDGGLNERRNMGGYRQQTTQIGAGYQTRSTRGPNGGVRQNGAGYTTASTRANGGQTGGRYGSNGSQQIGARFKPALGRSNRGQNGGKYSSNGAHQNGAISSSVSTGSNGNRNDEAHGSYRSGSNDGHGSLLFGSNGGQNSRVHQNGAGYGSVSQSTNGDQFMESEHVRNGGYSSFFRAFNGDQNEKVLNTDRKFSNEGHLGNEAQTQFVGYGSVPKLAGETQNGGRYGSDRANQNVLRYSSVSARADGGQNGGRYGSNRANQNVIRYSPVSARADGGQNAGVYGLISNGAQLARNGLAAKFTNGAQNGGGQNSFSNINGRAYGTHQTGTGNHFGSEGFALMAPYNQL